MTAKTFSLQLCLWIKVLVIALLLKKCSLTSLTSEDVRFAESRCQNDSLMASSELKIKWAHRNYPDNNITHCYVKCVLSRLGLIDLTYLGLSWEKLYTFWHDNDKDFDDECLQDIDFNDELDGTCYSYYKIWRSLWMNCEPLMRYVVTNKLQTRLKSIGVTATEFCDSLANEKDVASEISSDSEDTSTFIALYKCNLECVFRHFHYFDAYGRIDQFEILQSLVDAHVLTPNSFAAVRICSHRANSLFSFGYCEMAFELKKCLTGFVDFFTIYRVRDEITKYY